MFLSAMDFELTDGSEFPCAKIICLTSNEGLLVYHVALPPQILIRNFSPSVRPSVCLSVCFMLKTKPEMERLERLFIYHVQIANQ